MQKISTVLWYEHQAEEAAEHYVEVFNSRPGSLGTSKVTGVSRYGKAGPREPGSAMTVTFELEGQEYIALNGGPHHTFNEAISLLVRCGSQDEVDHFWGSLVSGGGEESMCGWLKDRYGLSWQIVPNRLFELIGDPDPERAKRATEAMLQMRKLDVAGLERAADAAQGPGA